MSAATSEPEFIEEPVSDVAFSIVITHKDGTQVKVNVGSRDAADLAALWKSKPDLREPEVYILQHGSGIQVFDLSTVQTINFMTGSVRQSKAMLKRVEDYANAVS